MKGPSIHQGTAAHKSALKIKSVEARKAEIEKIAKFNEEEHVENKNAKIIKNAEKLKKKDINLKLKKKTTGILIFMRFIIVSYLERAQSLGFYLFLKMEKILFMGLYTTIMEIQLAVPILHFLYGADQMETLRLQLH